MKSERIEFARKFARFAHDSIEQKRKYTGVPYYTHTEAVYDIVTSVTMDEDIRIAALFHDILEDVFPKNPFFSKDLIIFSFGYRVANLVNDLTDVYIKSAYPDLNRQSRHLLEVERLSKIHHDAKIIKLADLIHNTADIVENDKNFAITYLKEKAHLLPKLRVEADTRNKELFDIADGQLKKYLKQLDVWL